MNSQMSRDFEQLSAYIDNQLPPVEKAELEARLAKEAELQATLGDLRRAVQALRSLPPVKPPRNFTLTPQQVGARARRGPLFPVFRLPNAAALATPTPEGVVESYGASLAQPTGSPNAAVGVTPMAHLAPAGPAETETPVSGQSAATADATHKNLAPTETAADTAVSVAALPPSATATVTAAQNVAPQPNISAQSNLRVAEIVLAALALALAAAAWFTRRS